MIVSLVFIIQQMTCFIHFSNLNTILEFNVSSLHRDQLRLLLKQGGAAPGFSPDDGSGTLEIYRVENFELAALDPSAYGMFFGGDSYVIKYTYNVKGQDRYIIYFWQVSNSCFRQSITCLNTLTLFCRAMIAAKMKRLLQPFTLCVWIMKLVDVPFKFV